MARDAEALGPLSSEQDREAYLRETGAGLRVVYLDNTGTAPAARATSPFIAQRVAALSGDEGVKSLLRRHYRVQRVRSAANVAHAAVPRVFGPRLLADASADLAEELRDP